VLYAFSVAIVENVGPELIAIEAWPIKAGWQDLELIIFRLSANASDAMSLSICPILAAGISANLVVEASSFRMRVVQGTDPHARKKC